jgi:hypothetical protein
VSTEQKENLDAILRQSAFPADADVSELRRLLAEQASAQPLPAGVTVTAAALGGVPTAERAVLTARGPRVQIPPRYQEVPGQRPDRRERPPGLPSPGPSAHPGIVNDRSST